MAEISYRDAVTRGIAQEMSRDPDVVFLGEDVAKPGGCFKATVGLYEQFGGIRVRATPQYLEEVTAAPDEDGGGDDGGFGGGDGEGNDLYDRAVAVVTRDGKASTSYIQRRLQIGYNRAASLIERMEQEGVVSPANHAGKREILVSAAP